MNRLASIYPFVAAHWRTTIVISCMVGLASLICIPCLETEKATGQRIQLKRKRDLKVLTERISTYARNLQKRFPTGDVVVSEKDLAERLRRNPEMVTAAVNILVEQRKVQKAPLRGYWKLNIG